MEIEVASFACCHPGIAVGLLRRMGLVYLTGARHQLPDWLRRKGARHTTCSGRAGLSPFRRAADYQHRVLFWVHSRRHRAAQHRDWARVAALAHFSWIFYVFAHLIITD